MNYKEHAEGLQRDYDLLLAEFNALKNQPEQERFHVATIGNWGRIEWVEGIFPSVGDKMYSAPPQRTEQNFCQRCGKRTKDLTHIHTCTPPQEKNT